MKISPLNVLKYTLFLLFGLAITYYLFKTQYHSNFIDDLSKTKKSWIFISSFTVLVSHYFRALRWKLLIEPLKKNHKASTLYVFSAIMIGYLMNLVLPRAGEIARCAWLSRKEKLSTLSLIGTVITERIIDLAALGLIVLLGLGLYFKIILQFVEKLQLMELLFSKFYILVVLLLLLLIFIFIFYKIFTSQLAFSIKIRGFILQLKDGLLSLKNIKQPFLFTFYTVVIWVLYITSAYFGFKMLQETNQLNFADALLTVIAGSFGMIAPIQGGIGAFHFMVSQCLILLNINAETALVYATITHASQTLVVIIFGILAFIIGILHQLKSKNHVVKS